MRVRQVGITVKAVSFSVPRCTAADPPPRRFHPKSSSYWVYSSTSTILSAASSDGRKEHAAGCSPPTKLPSAMIWAASGLGVFMWIRGERSKLVYAGHRLTAALSPCRLPLIRLKDIWLSGSRFFLATHLNRFLSFYYCSSSWHPAVRVISYFSKPADLLSRSWLWEVYDTLKFYTRLRQPSSQLPPFSFLSFNPEVPRVPVTCRISIFHVLLRSSESSLFKIKSLSSCEISNPM